MCRKCFEGTPKQQPEPGELGFWDGTKWVYLGGLSIEHVSTTYEMVSRILDAEEDAMKARHLQEAVRPVYSFDPQRPGRYKVAWVAQGPPELDEMPDPLTREAWQEFQVWSELRAAARLQADRSQPWRYTLHRETEVAPDPSPPINVPPGAVCPAPVFYELNEIPMSPTSPYLEYYGIETRGSYSTEEIDGANAFADAVPDCVYAASETPIADIVRDYRELQREADRLGIQQAAYQGSLSRGAPPESNKAWPYDEGAAWPPMQQVLPEPEPVPLPFPIGDVVRVKDRTDDNFDREGPVVGHTIPTADATIWFEDGRRTYGHDQIESTGRSITPGEVEKLPK